MNFTKEQITELTGYLEGSCKSLDEGINDILSTADPLLEFDSDDLSMQNLDQIDSEVFHCAVCSWWFAADERSGDTVDETVCVQCDNH